MRRPGGGDGGDGMTAPAASGVPRGVLLSFQVAFFAISLNLMIVSPLLPELAVAFGRPVGDLGLLVTAFALPYALIAPLLGPASERLGRRVVVLGGMGCFVLGQLAAIVAPGLPALMAARALTGLGAASFSPAAYAYLSDQSQPGQRARTMSAVLLAATFGSIVGLPIGGLVMAAAGWRGAFGLLAALGLLTVLALAVSMKGGDQPVPVTRRYIGDLGAVLGVAGTLATLLVTVLWSAGYNGILAFLGALIALRYGLPAEQIALTLSGLGVAGLVGNRLGAWFGPRWSDRRMLLAAIVVLLAAALLLPLTTVALMMTLLVAGLLPAAVQFGWPALLGIVSDLAPDARATALALNSSAYYLGGALGPPLVGLAVSLAGIDAMTLPAAAAIGLALLLAVVAIPRPR